MKMLFLSMALVLSLTTANAQTERPQQRQRMDRTEMMVKEYGLDAQQAEKLKVLNEKYADMFRHGPRGGRPGGPRGGQDQRQRMQPPTDGQTAATPQPQRPQQRMDGDRQQRMEEFRKKMDEYNKELKGIMTESQYDAYQKKMEEMRKNRPMRRNQ